MRYLLFLAMIVSMQSVVVAQESFSVAELRFEGVFANRGDNQDTVYSLLGAGFFRAPSSGEEDSLILAWCAEHPEASAIPVCSMSPVMQDGTGVMIYIWVSEQEENLNEHLVRNGAFPAAVMADPMATAMEMRSVGQPLMGVHTILRYVSDTLYDDFMHRIRGAESAAVAEAIGLWEK